MPTPILRAARVLAAWLIAAAPSLALASEAAGEPWNDCNQNGVEDAVDIALGSSADVNQNGVPDECEALEPSAEPAPRIPGARLQPAEPAWVFPCVGRGCSERIEPLTGGARRTSARVRRAGEARNGLAG
ncbi:MAG: hypothetical protein IT453_22160 [Planctomycetes bacterium]|nr:hypothetical protein [Planctomycetota bacterium]